jgi:hypothetical protein
MKHRITDWEWYFSTLANMDFSSKVLLNMSELADEELKELRRWVSDECKKTAAQEYIVDFSSGIHKKRWSASLPPPSGPPVREVPKMLLEAGGSLGHADGFEESLKELELSVN